MAGEQQHRGEQQGMDSAGISSSSAPSTSYLSSASAIPPARYLDVAKNLFRYGSKPPRDRQENRKLDPAFSGLRGSALSQTTSHKVEVKINALDISEDRTHAILAGRRILKTVRVEGTQCSGEFDLRAAAIEHANSGKSYASLTGTERSVAESRQRETQGIEDVSWSVKAFSSHVATAGSNGKVILWDIQRPEVELARLHEHQRQVHRVTFNQFNGAYLLSASQDTTVRLWDIRSPQNRPVTIIDSRSTFHSVDGVRDVKWSPTNGTRFALGTETGTVQCWDILDTRRPLLKIAAHDKTCTTIDWHPDGHHLVSGSKDHQAKIWDLSSTFKRQKAKYYFRTPYEIRTVRWRSSCNISPPHQPESWQCAQLAVSYEDHPAVHIWDWRRPLLPRREICFGNSDTGPADMLWHSQNLLWAVGHGEHQGDFAQTDVQFAPKPLDRRAMQTVSTSPNGDAALFAQERLRPPKFMIEQSFQEKSLGQARYKGQRQLPFSRSLDDDSLDENFLCSPISRRHGRTPSAKSARSVGSTPPSEEQPGKTSEVLRLDDILKNFQSFKPKQWSGFVFLPGADSALAFRYLAQNYKVMTPTELTAMANDVNGAKIFEQNAAYAQGASFYRDSQTWKILGFLILKELTERAMTNRKRRVLRERTELPRSSSSAALDTNSMQIEQGQPKRKLDHGAAAKGVDGTHLRITESSSNVQTPLAKPFRDPENSQNVIGNIPPSISTLDEDVQLPPSLASAALDSKMSSRTSSADQRPSPKRSVTASANWYPSAIDRDEKLASLSQWRAPRRMPLDPATFVKHSNVMQIPPRMERQDSSESLMLFSASAESGRELTHSTSIISGTSQSSENTPPKWEITRNIDGTGQESSKSEVFRSSLDQATESSAGMLAHPESKLSESGGRDSSSMDEGQYHSLAQPILQRVNTGETTSFDSTTYNSSQSSKQYPSSKWQLSAESDQILPNSSDISFQAAKKDPGNPNSIAEVNRKNQDQVRGEIVIDFKSIPFVLNDYLAHDEQHDGGKSRLFESGKTLYQLLKWYSSHSNAQMAAHLFLCWQILLPPAKNALSTEFLILDGDCIGFSDFPSQPPASFPNDTSGISPLWIESILYTYHEHLMSQKLLNPAASLRRLAFPAFPAVYEASLKEVDIGTRCRGCRKPINNPRGKMRCETCRERQASCAICWMETSPFELASDSSRKKQADRAAVPPTATLRHADDKKDKKPPPVLWSSCLRCSHSNHASCLSVWLSDPFSEGACPVSGCICDCSRGSRRNKRLETERIEAERAKLAAKAGIVRGDEWSVGESRAVGRATRNLLGGSGEVSPGVERERDVGKERDKGRRVRVVEPDRER